MEQWFLTTVWGVLILTLIGNWIYKQLSINYEKIKIKLPNWLKSRFEKTRKKFEDEYDEILKDIIDISNGQGAITEMIAYSIRTVLFLTMMIVALAFVIINSVQEKVLFDFLSILSYLFFFFAFYASNKSYNMVMKIRYSMIKYYESKENKE